MTLDEATSKEQVEEALAAGDEELRADIDEKLRDVRDRWEAHQRNYVGYNDELPDVSLASDTIVDAVIEQSPDVFDLAHVPRELVVAALEAETLGHPTRRETFSFGELRRRFETGFQVTVPQYMSACFPDDLVPENAEFIPADLAAEFWSELGYGIEWDQTSEIGENSGTVEGDPTAIKAGESDFWEFCRDIVSNYIDGLIECVPDRAKQEFLGQIPATLGGLIRESGMSDEDVLDLAHRWFVTSERDEIVEEVREFSEALQRTDEPPEVIAEASRDDLKKLGVAKGTLFEEAPWKLIKLRPWDLRLEGTRMRHCVGDHGMGYIRAVKDGDIEIWSLRSREGKPRFTLEVDGDFSECGERTDVAEVARGLLSEERDNAERDCRAAYIKQVKGKANRLPGYASVRDSEIRFPDEVLFWAWFFDKLGIDPQGVADFGALAEYDATHRLTTNPSRSFNRSYSPLLET